MIAVDSSDLNEDSYNLNSTLKFNFKLKLNDGALTGTASLSLSALAGRHTVTVTGIQVAA